MKNNRWKTLGRVLKLVYKTSPLCAIIRDIVFLLNVFLEMYLIFLGGKFIDSTVQILLNYKTFDLSKYFISDSFFLLTVIVIIWLLTVAFPHVYEFLEEKLTREVSVIMQTEFYNKISRENLEDVETKEFRDLLTLVQSYSFSSVWEVYRLFIYITKDISSIIFALSFLILKVGITPIVLVLIAIPEPIAGYINRMKLKNFRNSSLEKIKWFDYASTLMTRIQFFPEMRVDGTFKELKNDYAKSTNEYKEGIVERLKHLHIDTTLFAVLGKVGVGAYTIFLLAQTVILKYTIGTFNALFGYANTTYNSSYDAINRIFTISNELDYASHYFELVNFSGFGEVEHGIKKLTKGVPNIEFKDLDFAYPNDKKKVINNLNLDIPAKSKIMIIGKDGSGKSTFVKLLCGLYKITAGDLEIGKYSIRELARGELKKKISIIFQDFVNYNLPLKKNITLGNDRDNVDSQLYQIAKDIAGIDKMMKIFGLSESQMLGKYTSDGTEISPGFWQRLAIARVIYRNKEVIILDEPFTFIDSTEASAILKKILAFAKDKTVIYISRDENYTELFDKVYRLENKKLIENA